MAGATPEARTAVEEDEVLATEDVVDDFVEATEAEELVAADDDDDDDDVVVVVVVGDRKVWWAPRGREKRPPQSSNSGVHFRTSYHADRNNWNARSMSASLRDRTNASSSVVTGGSMLWVGSGGGKCGGVCPPACKDWTKSSAAQQDTSTARSRNSVEYTVLFKMWIICTATLRG